MHKRVGRPPAKYSQAGRVLRIYDLLHRRGVVHAAELADELRVSKRTLQRDIALLGEVLEGGLESVHVPTLGFRLPHSKRRSRATVRLVMGMIIGMKLMRFLSGRTFDAELKPLLSELRQSLPELKHVDTRDLERRLHIVESGQKLYARSAFALELLDELVRALLLQQPIEIKYHSPRRQQRNDAARALTIQVLCMTIYRGAVYFVADVLSGDWEAPARRILLALDRITAARIDVSARALVYPKDFNAHTFFTSAFGVWRGEATHHVSVRIGREYASAVRERAWHETQRIEQLTDGALRVTMTLGTLEEVADWICGMGEHACVEAPAELKELIKGRLSRALANYDDHPAT